MSLFQPTVLKEYLTKQDNTLIDKAYKKYVKYFHDPNIQKNIKASKEEQFQEGFLRELLVNVLGYTINPNPKFNLTTEFKNQRGAKKADGAILKDGKALAVIELKGTNTKDLESIRRQAFDYKANQAECIYVITSNFEKLRFYIHDATNYIEFNLFSLDKDQFALLYLCLQADNLLSNLPQTIKKASVAQEEKITKTFYADYSLFKRELFRDLVKKNMKNEVFRAELQKEDADRAIKNIKLSLFKKSQKLIDRFLFIFFAEDCQLLPANSTLQILDKWKRDVEFGEDKQLYDIFKVYFKVLDEGRKGTERQAEIFAYNGGLFKPDNTLNSLLIDNELLYNHTKKLSNYDFSSQLDVNILGHIFENSLNEIESINAEIEGTDFDKQKTKRKKDGVFYTPKYITKYIVDNTVGKLCEEKRQELGIYNEDYSSSRQMATKKKLLAALEAYREWLLKITILDPACGSGAFLNQALDFLINEHRLIDEQTAQLSGSSIIFPNIENTILENNIYGVDLNEESVEIAKLSLWLRTAQPRRKLTSLNDNIKCGNSLIDDPKVAGDKAFNWQQEFPEVFKEGGFDVVIGNPPYVNAMEIKKNFPPKEYDFLKSHYNTAKGTVDLYIYFYERGLLITKPKGLLSYITPNRFLSASYGKALREILLKEYEIYSLIDYSDKKVFPDASTYPVIAFFRNQKQLVSNVLTGKFDETSKTLISENYPSNQLNILDDSILGFLLNDKLKISKRILEKCRPLSDVGKINATSTAKEADELSAIINNEKGFKLINTGTIDPFVSSWGISELTDKGKKYLTPYLPLTHTLLSSNREKLYSSPKIIIAKIGLQCEAFYDSNGEFASINTNCIHSFNKNYIPEYVTCWLNSKLYNYIFECLFDGLRMSGGYLLFSAPNLKNTGIKKIPTKEQTKFLDISKLSYELRQSILNKAKVFTSYLSSQYSNITLSRKLFNWYNLDFSDFIKELNKVIKKAGGLKLTKSDEMEWMELFEEKKKDAQTLQTEIEKTDKEIDRIVYELYGLSEEEIKIVEGNC